MALRWSPVRAPSMSSSSTRPKGALQKTDIGFEPAWWAGDSPALHALLDRSADVYVVEDALGGGGLLV